MQPSAKRNAAQSARCERSASSTTATDLLLDAGMPLSISRLVCDLLDGTANPCTLDEALWDLSCMKTSPRLFLFDRTCPQQALEDACLFRGTRAHLFGRKNEMNALFNAKDKIASYVRAEKNNHALPSSSHGNITHFLCETVYLRGYAGSGKSSLMYSVMDACKEDDWFILECKFDKEKRIDIPLAFNNFFGKCHQVLMNKSELENSPLVRSYQSICRTIFAVFDMAGLIELFDLIPNLAHVYPTRIAKARNQRNISSMDKVGSGEQRRFHMFRLLFKSLCSAGRPVLLALDDLQWAGPFSMEFLEGFLEYMHATPSSVVRNARRKGLLILGAYRSNEVEADGDLMNRVDSIKQSGNANFMTLTVGEVPKDDINKLISAKLCLPRRYTQELSEIVHSKTKGNAFFVVEFVRSIIQNKCLQFSVRSRRWVWDNDAILMSTISDGVAELLLSSFHQLPRRVMQTLKIISCLEYQVEEWLMDALDYNNEILSFNMKDQLECAVQENFLENAGPVWQFTHDIVKSTIYDLIPKDNRTLLHKTIGENLIRAGEHFPAESTAIHQIAICQINKFCKHGHLDKQNRLQFAFHNATAAKYALTSCNFEEARLSIDMAIELLEDHHWETHYSLSLELFEMSASVSCIHGDITKISSCVDEILTHAKSIDDSLKASSFLVKVLAASSKFQEAITKCLVILENLGEHFQTDDNAPPSASVDELSVVIEILLRNNFSCEKFKLLPPMSNKRKINAMKFMNMACQYSVISRPTLVPLLSCRMVRLTMEYGFCDDSIVGLATVGYCSYTFTENMRLGSKIAKVCEALIRDNPNEHLIRSRLCTELVVFHIFTQPAAAVMTQLPIMYESAKLTGDMESATLARWNCCAFVFWSGAESLLNVSKHLSMCIKEALKHKQTTMLYCAMAYLNTCLYLSGETDAESDTKSFDELNEIGKSTKANLLLWQCHICKICEYFFMRDYLAVISLCEANPCPRPKRILHGWRTFFEGVACLSLARDTKQSKWRCTGEKAVWEMSRWAEMSPWNFESRYRLLQAELYYLDGDMASAEEAYNASVLSAQKHNYVNDEAIACELYGIHLVERKSTEKGVSQLLSALGKYKEWGATKKAKELQLFIETIHVAGHNSTYGKRP